jgi:hypothetical protein
LVNKAVQRFLHGLAAGAYRGAERREEARRSTVDRRFGERRDPIRATAGRRVFNPSDRRMAERRGL